MEYKIINFGEVDKDLTDNDREMDRRAKEAVRADLENAKIISRYDVKTKKCYIETK